MRKKVKWIILILSISIAGIAVYYGYTVIKFGMNIHEGSGDSRFDKFRDNEQGASDQPPEWKGTERVNVLLLGGDSRGIKNDEAPRSDTMMIVSFNPVTKQAHLYWKSVV